jgi:hypothetical protein
MNGDSTGQQRRTPEDSNVEAPGPNGDSTGQERKTPEDSKGRRILLPFRRMPGHVVSLRSRADHTASLEVHVTPPCTAFPKSSPKPPPPPAPRLDQAQPMPPSTYSLKPSQGRRWREGTYRGFKQPQPDDDNRPRQCTCGHSATSIADNRPRHCVQRTPHPEPQGTPRKSRTELLLV